MSARPSELTPDRSARHLFGAKMRAHRERAGMSLEGLSDVVNISRSHLSRIEMGDAMPPPSLPARLDAAFGTDGIFQELYAVATNEFHPDQYRRRMALEARARLIEGYAGQFVPGLVQTEAYARASFIAGDPEAPQEEIEKLVMARMSRQTLLTANSSPSLSYILDEAVLRRGFGGPEVMWAQLARLVEMALNGSALMQVLPFTAGGHALAGGTLTLMTIDKGTRVAYDEGVLTGTLIEEVESVAKRQRAYDRIRASALSPRDSAAFIRSVMEELPT